MRSFFHGTVCAIWFLVLPNVLFQAFWLRFPLNVILPLITIYGAIAYGRLNKSNGPQVDRYTMIKYLIGSMMITLVFVFFSGAGGFVWQKPDWMKHNVVLHDLISHDWPVQYASAAGGPHQTLVYYLGYYLLPALAGKWFGWDAARIVLFTQTCIGVLLFAHMIKIEINHSARKLFLFFFISGADVLGILILREWPGIYMHIENYAIDLQFSSVLTQLGWVPQHALAGWIGVMLAYRDFQTGRLAQTLPFVLGITFIWSPFIALGIFCVFIPFYITKYVHRYVHFLSIIGVILSGTTLIYLTSRIRMIDDKVGIYLFARHNIIGSLGVMLLFLMLDVYVFGLFFVLVRKAMNRTHTKFIIWLITLLILIPQVMYGASNDFVMRVSIPVLALIFVLLLSYINYLNLQKPILQGIIIALFVCGMFTPFAELLQTQIFSEFAPHERPKGTMADADVNYRVLNKQYLGDTSKPFAVLLGNYKK